MATRRCRTVALVAFVAAALVGIVLLAISAADVRRPPDFMYGIVLDAGSSHTAMFIYKWPADKQKGTGIVTQHTDCHVKGGGISSYAGKQGEAGRSLETCLDQAKQDIPQSRHHQTPVYLGATAGMRLLNMSNPKESDKILEEVGKKLKMYPFDFRGASILSGQEEGAYGWVTVNYLLENFIKYSFVGQWLIPSRKTVGALDFGGASTQITFETQSAIEDKDNKMTLQLYGQNYSLYTQSFLCYGRDQVLRKLLAHLLQIQHYSSVISNPCYPDGHRVTMTLDKIFDSPCTADMRPTMYKPESSMEVQGSGDYKACLGNVSEMFSFKNCPFSKCSFNGVFQPNVTGNFMAFSAFFYTYSFLQRTTGITVSSPRLLDNATRAVCNLSMEEMLQKAPDQQGRIQDYCAASVFIQVLLLQGYKFDELSFSHITFQKKVEDTSVGWAMGYMLSLSSLLPGESLPLQKAISPQVWGGLLFLFAFMFVIGVAFLFTQVLYKKKKSNSNMI